VIAGENTARGYIPQIDTLRAVAVGLVFLEHYLPQQTHELGITGGYGVWLFFSISGFLITGILLGYKSAIESGNATLLRVLMVFYARRSLRIFPAYYLLLFVLLMSGFLAWRGEFFWHLAYLSNFWTAKYNVWSQYAGHFWSLSVEEQFYLAWPFILLIAPRKALPWIIGAGIAIALIFRLCAARYNLGLAGYTMPIANFDTLGAGALLAWAHQSGRDKSLALLRRHGGWLLLMLPAMSFWPEPLKALLGPTAIALIAVYLIERCVAGFDGVMGWLFSRPSVLYLGKISYGLYLYHYVARWYFPKGMFDGIYAQPYVQALAWAVATIVIASLSRVLLEEPINGLKRYFQIGSANGRLATTRLSTATV
jgi:peptidoglycan/LPS O-acetylase OafA/YrhL